MDHTTSTWLCSPCLDRVGPQPSVGSLPGLHVGPGLPSLKEHSAHAVCWQRGGYGSLQAMQPGSDSA